VSFRFFFFYNLARLTRHSEEFRDYYERECEKEVVGSKGSGVTVDCVRTL
jgi:hypothetical protein